MTGRAPRYDFGDAATGVVVNENDWGSSGPRVIPPRRTASGTVVGLFPMAPDVVKVRTAAGETVCVRTGGRR